MSRISKYQDSIRNFLKNKSFIKHTSQSTRQIMLDMLEESDHFPGILCLAVVGGRCKQGGIKMHGYLLASGIEGLMMAIKILNNRKYYDSKYSTEKTSNMIVEVTNWFYDCLTENINTLRMSNEDKVDIKKLATVMTKCINYAVRRISKINEIKEIQTLERMKRTDLFCIDFDQASIDNYRHMKRTDQKTMMDNIKSTYGMVCRLAMCLGWMITMGDDTDIPKLEALADHISVILKVHDDFKNYKRDMRYGDICSNFLVTHGLKEALILFDHSSISYAEKTEEYGIETRTCNEIVKVVTDFIDLETQDVSVDLDTEFDEISLLSTMSESSRFSRCSKRNQNYSQIPSVNYQIDSTINDISETNEPVKTERPRPTATKSTSAKTTESQTITRDVVRKKSSKGRIKGGKSRSKSRNKRGTKGNSKGGSKSGQERVAGKSSYPNSGKAVSVIT